MTVLVAGLSERQSLRWLSDAVQADVEPVLTLRELRDLLPVAAIADVSGNLPDRFDRWEANEVFAVGDYVVPDPRNGFVYRASVGGQVGSTAPTWSTTIDATFGDGQVTWVVADEASWAGTYCQRRLNKAAAAGWRMKAGKLTNNETFSADGTFIQAQLRRGDMLKMADYYAKKGGAGTLDLGGSVYGDYPSNVVLVS